MIRNYPGQQNLEVLCGQDILFINSMDEYIVKNELF